MMTSFWEPFTIKNEATGQQDERAKLTPSLLHRVAPRLLAFSLLTGILLVTTLAFIMAEPAQQLPEDNLIRNPWFRDQSNTTASHDEWVITDAWGLSQKNSNPTFDDVVGTSARIGTPKASYDELHAMYQVVEADPTQPVLIFQMWQVSRSLNELKATIYGGNSPDGPWQEVWQPWVQQQSSVHWMQTPLFETELEEGYPFYKLELACSYSHGIAGCKYTGVYFTVSDELGQGTAVESAPTPPASDDGAPLPTTESGGRVNPAAVNLMLDEVSVTAVSANEIILTWPQHEQADATYQIERSPDGRGGWQIIEQVSADEWQYADGGLEAGSEYFYRIQVNFATGGRSRSPIFSATTLLAEPPQPSPTTAPETSIDPTPTQVVEEVAVVESEPTETPLPEAEVQPTVAVVDEAETAVATQRGLDQWGMLLIGFGLGALLVGGFWTLSRRKVN